MTTTTVEVAFDGTTLVDVTSWLRNVQVRRGRANDLATVDPGTLTVELDNADGRFTPTNSQSPYSPDVKPAVSVRLSVSAGSGPDLYRLFTGRAQRWEPRWDVGGRPIVVLEAVDGFEQLANTEVQYAYRQDVLANSPDAYWTLGDAILFEETGHADLTLDTWASAGTKISTGAGPLVTGGRGSIEDSGDPVLTAKSLPADWSGNSTDITYTHVFRFTNETPDTSGGRSYLCGVTNVAEDVGWYFFIDNDQLNFIFVDTSGAGVLLTSDPLSWATETVYHVGFFWDVSTKTVTFYRDGSAVGSGTAADVPGAVSPNSVFFLVGSAYNFNVAEHSDVALWTSDMSSLMPTFYSALTGHSGDLPGARVARVLDWAGWDASARDIGVGTTPLGAVASGSALSACQDAAAADGGVFFIDAEGNATFQGRRERWEDPAAIDYSDRYVDTYGGTVVDFDDDGTDTGYQTVGWRYDTTLLANRVTVNSNTQGTSDGVAEDSTSQTAYGLRTLTVSTASNNTADNVQRARWELSRRKDPHLRLEEVGFLVADTVQEDAAGALELQSLVEVNRRPGSGQDDLTVTMRVASIDHTISDGGTRWDARFGLLEADTDQPGVYGTAVYGSDYYGY